MGFQRWPEQCISHLPIGEGVCVDQSKFRCDTCGSPHVSIPATLEPESKVRCGRCGGFIATWADYRQAICLIVAETGKVVADPVLLRD